MRPITQFGLTCMLVCWTTLASAEPLPVPMAPSVETVQPAVPGKEEIPVRAPSAAASEAAHCRAGYPLMVAPWARLTYGPKYSGYLVGGGKIPTKYPKRIHAEAPYTDEGTWAIDYTPWWSRVQLLWSHGQLYQGGVGQYEPDHKNNPFDQRFGRKVESAE